MDADEKLARELAAGLRGRFLKGADAWARAGHWQREAVPMLVEFANLVRADAYEQAARALTRRAAQLERLADGNPYTLMHALHFRDAAAFVRES